jgi:hypothetical protein
LVRIYGRLDNTGSGYFRRVEIQAVLRSRGRDKRGENTVLLENIQPRESRVFSVTVTAHGAVADVELEVTTPETP